MEHLGASSSSDLESTLTNQPVARRAPWRVLAATAGVLAGAATIGIMFRSAQPSPAQFESNILTGLREEYDVEEEFTDVCDAMPFLRIMDVVTSNLGGDGPDKEAEEGIIYKARAYHVGLEENDIEIHLHATNEYHRHELEEGTKIDPEYKPKWRKDNGIDGHFATVNMKPNSNVTLRLHAYDATKGEDITMPRFAMTFFDLDMGKHGKCREYLHLSGYDNYFTTKTTQVEVEKLADGSSTFKATREGSGSDNPKDPLQLTRQQKDKAVSFTFSNVEEVKFEIGAEPGETGRKFFFVLRPALRCANTKMPNGNLIPANSKDSPVKIEMGSASGVRQGVAILAAALSLLFAH